MKRLALCLLLLASLSGCEVCFDASGQNCKQARDQCAIRFLEAPHEQQPEPIPAATQGGLSVERWVL